MEELFTREWPKTRLQQSMGEQPVTQSQVKEIIDAALKPVRDFLGKLPDGVFIDEAIEKVKAIFEEKLEERDKKIKSLEDRIERLESSLAVVNRLEYRIDNEEQYSRRQCLRINNVELPGDEESEDCMQKVEDILTELDCGVGIDSVDRAHRIGQRKISDDDGKVQQQIIVRFSSFRDRTKVYRNRKKLDDIKIRLDLTRSRLGTLKQASEWAKGCGDVSFAFADINYNLAAKMKNGKFLFFSSVSDLQQKVEEENSEN